MSTCTTLCLLEDESDIPWISGYLAAKGEQERVIIAVYSLMGRLAAEKTTLPCTHYEELAQSIDPFAVSGISRRKATFWSEGAGPLVSTLPTTFKGYPLAVMHAFNLMLSINWFLPSFFFMHRLLGMIKPDKVLMGGQENRFLGRWSIHTSAGPDGGFERESAQALCGQLGIPAFAHDGKDFRPVPGPVEAAFAVEAATASAPRQEDLEAPRPWRYEQAPGYHALEDHPPKGTRQCHLFFAFGYFHLDDLLACIDALLERGCQVVVVITGGEVEPEKLKAYGARGVRFYRKESFRLEEEATLLARLQERYNAASAHLSEAAGLEDFFSASGASFYKGLAEPCLEKELRNMPFTILELLRTEAVLEAFAPDAVFVHFSLGCYDGWGNYDVLPARKLGIPTLSFDHGINGIIGASLSLPATQYHASYGEVCRQAIIGYSGFAADSIRAVGNPRYETLARTHDTRAEKLRLGLDPDRPVVVFCSTSEVMGLYEYHHAAHANIQAVLQLKRQFPGVQLIYRVHHGLDYARLRRHFQELAIPDLHFEVSLEPPHVNLVDLLKGTDALISQAASCLTEAVVMGVPVIYYCARANVDPLFLGTPCIAVASTDAALPELLRRVLAHPLPPAEAEAHRQRYLDRAVCGNDGQAGRRLADFLQDIVRAPREPGWADWLANMARQCHSQDVAVDPASFNQARQSCPDDEAAHALALEQKRRVRAAQSGSIMAATVRGFWPEVG